ncbi:tRNA(Met) cytidine acetyltransferase TmcA [Biostraticola tofi]|uniref:tRNA(Met) cytidine acetyltransferase TmcA n=1 Tax=Biostraticola tofi TaxID=466109 RepID=UPI001404EAAA|nr:GNAT family N-acetyltransferase [Biostraticola tofi]
MAFPVGSETTLNELTRQMGHCGIRRLMVLSGDAEWAGERAAHLRQLLPGDWLWAGPQPLWQPSCLPAAMTGLLGREFRHGVFDARCGLHAEALAALAGTLTAGSWLVLLAPAWDAWPTTIDQDSRRWNEGAHPIATPHFIRHLQQSLLASAETLIVHQHRAAPALTAVSRPRWQAPTGKPTARQQQLVEELVSAGPGNWIVTAARGRGKSTLAGMFTASMPGRCRVTAPSRAAAQVLLDYGDCPPPFFAPDALLAEWASLPTVDWLIIDEAAAIPMPVLRRLTALCPRVLMTTTVQGYEGTGRGFVLKFCPTLDRPHFRVLDQPLRWAQDDPLEQWLISALWFDDRPTLAEADADSGQHPEERSESTAKASIPMESAVNASLSRESNAEPERISTSESVSESVYDFGSEYLESAEHRIRCWPQDYLQCHPLRMKALYQLLTAAHYRTSPLDLRRLMDAAGMHFMAAVDSGRLLAALWLVDEGGLPPGLAHEIWAGRRRPPGNLVAQSLAAHGDEWQAPVLRSRRISRIAVTPGQRRRGIGLELVQQAVAAAGDRDFLSVSFGYTDSLWRFWRSAGFELVRIGTHLEASSGCYNAMALLPISQRGRELTLRAAARFVRDWSEKKHPMETVAEDDWRCLAGFAFAHRPADVCLPALRRLLGASGLPLPLLRQWAAQGPLMPSASFQAKPAGRKAWLAEMRQEAAEAMWLLDRETCLQWQAWSAPGGYVTSSAAGDGVIFS